MPVTLVFLAGGDDHRACGRSKDEIFRSLIPCQAKQGMPITTLEYGYGTSKEKMARPEESTINLAFHKALEIQLEEGAVSGPKKLGGFGARYQCSSIP